LLLKAKLKALLLLLNIYLKNLSYNIPFKIYSINIQGKIKTTTNLGRGIEHLIPNIVTVLIAIDVIQLLIEVYEIDKKNNKVTFKGFGNGGSFGGGGSSEYW
jgi:uncharacterized membrane protein (DUF373 family)